jgi:uncharacterized protein involved in cysteine biosynthesis
MGTVIASLLKAVRQLGDPAVLRVLAKSLGATLAVFALVGIGLYFALRAGLAYAGLGEDALGDGGVVSAIATVALAVLAFWFLFRIVALAVLQFFADEIVAAVEARHYPQAARAARPLPLRQELAHSLRGMGRALGYNLLALPVALALSVTGIGPAVVFVLVNAVLLGREVTDMAWLRHCGGEPGPSPVAWPQRFALGGVVAGMMLVPGLGLLAPVIGAAAGTHVAHRAMARGGLKAEALPEALAGPQAGGENDVR